MNQKPPSAPSSDTPHFDSGPGTDLVTDGPGDPLLLEHEYDGILEYDNPLPGWWSGIFILTIMFSIGYWVWFSFGGPGADDEASFDRAWAVYSEQKARLERDNSFTVNEQVLARMAADPHAVNVGQYIFAQHCVGCHLADGSGIVGPNLTDEFQIHGTTGLDLYETIRDGVPDKGMIAWGVTLSEKDMASVAAYVWTLRGKNLSGKEPQGERIADAAESP